MKPRILLDIDGICADFITPALTAIYEHTGAWYNSEMIVEWDIMKSCGISTETAKTIYKSMEKPGLCLSIEPYPGARDGIDVLRKFADVWAVTSPFGGPHWMHERDQWLVERMGFDKKDVLHVRGERKHGVGGHVLVEDKVETLMSWRDHHPHGMGILFERRYNKDAGWDGTRVKSWPQLVAFLEAMFL